LTESVDARTRNVAERNSAAHAVLDLLRFGEPLVGFEECARQESSKERVSARDYMLSYLSRRMIPFRFWAKPRVSELRLHTERNSSKRIP
jgi:hypothetical protein